MLEIWRVKVVESANVHVGDTDSREKGKKWAADKLSELGYDVTMTWRDRERSSVSVPGPGLEAHVTLRD